MSEPADPGDIWEGIPVAIRKAVAALADEARDAGLGASLPGALEKTGARLAALLREAAADQARLDWLERAVPEGLFRRLTDDLRGEWHGSFREWIDAARGSVPSPTPTKE